MTASSPGWYPDPERHGQLRWWDGQAWTAHQQAGPTIARTEPTTEPAYPAATSASPVTSAYRPAEVFQAAVPGSYAGVTPGSTGKWLGLVVALTASITAVGYILQTAFVFLARELPTPLLVGGFGTFWSVLVAGAYLGLGWAFARPLQPRPYLGVAIAVGIDLAVKLVTIGVTLGFVRLGISTLFTGVWQLVFLGTALLGVRLAVGRRS